MARKNSKSAQVQKRDTPPSPPLEPIVTQPSEDFKEALYKELQRMEQSKREAKRQPEHTLSLELSRHVSDTLNALYKDGRIRTGNTVNDKYIITQ